MTSSGGLLVSSRLLRKPDSSVDGLRHCCNRISQLANEYRRVKIGITGDPWTRARRYTSPYMAMEPLWETQDKLTVEVAEAWLIEHLRQYLDNEAAGGTGDVKGPPYYLYVVYS